MAGIPPIPPVPPGGPPPPVPPAPVPVTHPGTFADLWETQEDPLDGNYREYMASYAPTGAANAALSDQVFQSSDAIAKIFVLMTTANPPVIQCVLAPWVFSPTMGLHSIWDNQRFVFLGDVGIGNQISSVRWPVNSFERNLMARVPTTDTMDAAWSNAAGADCVGPFADGAADTEEVQTRRMMAIPQRYAPYVIRTGEFTPQEFWTGLYPQFVMDRVVGDLAPLVDWMRVASTYLPPANAADPAVLPPIHGTALAPVVQDAVFNAKVWA